MKSANEITPQKTYHPGIVLGEEIDYRQMTKKEVAAAMKVSPTVLSELISGKRNFSTAIAIKIEQALGINALFFLSMQMRHDYYSLKKELKNLKNAA